MIRKMPVPGLDPGMDADLPKDHAPTKKLDHDPIQFDRIMAQGVNS
jgi:hypothetical protein